MPPITRFDRATCRRLGQETADALAPLARRYGLDVRYAGGSFSDGNCKLKVEYVAHDADGHAQTPEREAWGRGPQMKAGTPQAQSAEHMLREYVNARGFAASLRERAAAWKERGEPVAHWYATEAIERAASWVEDLAEEPLRLRRKDPQ